MRAVILVFLAYVLSGKVGLALASVHVSVSAIWPPSGIALAACLVLGGRAAVGIWLGAFVVNLTTWGGPGSSSLIATGNTLEAVLGAWLVRRYTGGRRALEHPTTMVAFCCLAGLLACALAASVGVATLARLPEATATHANWLTVWLTWWLGDLLGVLVFAPPVLLWWNTPRPRWGAGGVRSTAAALALTLLLGMAVFLDVVPPPLERPPLAFLVFPAVTWAAYRLGPREATTITLALSVLAIWATSRGLGPFVRPTVNQSVLFLQAFMATLSGTGLALGLVAQQRRGMEAELRLARDELEHRVASRTRELTRTVATLQEEIVERRRAEENHAISEAKLAEAQALAHIGSWEWSSARGEVTCSAELLRLLEVDATCFRGTPGELLDRIPGDERERVCRALRAIFTDHVPFSLDHRVTGADGSVRWLSSRGQAAHAADGTARVHGTCQDITPRREAEERFRGLLESAPDAMLIMDPAGTIQLVNARAEVMFGCPRAELLGRSVDTLLPERLRPRLAALRADYLRAPTQRRMGAGLELCALDGSGREFPVEIALSPVSTSEGLLITAAVRDISERKRVEQALRESLRLKEVLIGEIHHRVKNNLQVITSLLNLQAARQESGPARDALRESLHRVHALAVLHERVYQSQDVSRIDMRAYLSRLLSDLAVAYGVLARGVTVRARIEPGTAPADLASTCAMLVTELASNSFKHAFPGDRGGSVEVSLARGAGVLELRVSDDGVGLPADWDRQPARKLGLQVVSALVRQLGGTMTVDRRHGSCFTITFPGALRPESAAPQPPGATV
ncbi:MAG: MASE1 domain-containing protein [Myxococcota bacterium]